MVLDSTIHSPELDSNDFVVEDMDDLMQSSDSNSNSNSYSKPPPSNPPANIAARIYKARAYQEYPPYQRHPQYPQYPQYSQQRRTSAASSRRNSLTSTSHHSSRSGRSARSAHGGPFSTHVAQHLRRASIIESRKAKAADRNAHAEQVRLRAALHKAAPRVTTAESEGRADAARQARERYLAQVRANCAAEVRKSKRVAEEQREKRAAEHLKLKEDLAERHAQAERRRILAAEHGLGQRRGSIPAVLANSASAGAGVGRPSAPEGSNDGSKSYLTKPSYIWKPFNESDAARRVQRAWRQFYRRRAIQNFLELDLTVEGVRNVSFEEIGLRLNDSHLLQTTTRMLKILQITPVSSRGDDADAKLAARGFLSTFLILGHPSYVLNREGEQEKELMLTANDLLTTLNTVMLSTMNEIGFLAAPCPDCLSGLMEAHASFTQSLAAWRSSDSSFMISNMVAQFVELDSIWQSVKDDADGAVAADYKQGIQHNQTLVLARLKKLAGPSQAMALIREAVQQSRKSKMRAKAKSANAKANANVNLAKTKPRVVNSVESAAPLTAQETPATCQASNDTETVATAMAETQSDPAHQDRQRVRGVLGASSLIPDNRTIVHELSIDKEWRIDVESQEAKEAECITSIVSQLQHAVDADLQELWIPALAESIQQKLCGMLAPNRPFQVMIRETLDADLIAQQVRSGAFSYENFFSFMNTILPKLCAPVRDDRIRQLAEQTPSQVQMQAQTQTQARTQRNDGKGTGNGHGSDPIRHMARICFTVDLLTLDMLNFQLMSIAPTLLEEATGYESRAFDREMEMLHRSTYHSPHHSNNRCPDRVLQWWREARLKTVEANVAITSTSTSANATNVPNASNAVAQGRRVATISPPVSSSLSMSSSSVPSSSSSNAPRVFPSSPSATPHRIYMQGLTSLISPGVYSIYPETLHLDISRVERIRSDIIHMVTVASVLVNAKSLLRRDTRSSWKSESQRMWELGWDASPSASSDATPSAFVGIVESRYALPASTRQSLTTFVARVLSEARKLQGQEKAYFSSLRSDVEHSQGSSSSISIPPSTTTSSLSSTTSTTSGPKSDHSATGRAIFAITHPVMRVLFKKIGTYILARLSASSSDERIRVASTATETLGSIGLSEFVGRLGDMVVECERIGQIDRAAHGTWYDKVMELLGLEEQEQEQEQEQVQKTEREERKDVKEGVRDD